MNRFTLKLVPGWFRTANNSLDVRSYPDEEICLGGDDPLNSCEEGHVL